ncbi:MAG: hypothetical protein N3A66_05235, partial [Planctomycetota bacterium]|nr:hypothetical protein [Planctomycetota bacterium]
MLAYAQDNKTTPAAAAAAEAPALQPLAGKTAVLPLKHAFVGYTPLRRVQRLVANRRGQAAVYLNKAPNDDVVFVDEKGQVVGSFALPQDCTRLYDTLDEQGVLWCYTRQPLAFNPAWHYATHHEVRVHGIRADGSIVKSAVLYRGNTEMLASEWQFEQMLPIAPDGRTAFVGRLAGYWLGNLTEGKWSFYDDVPQARTNFEIRAPRSALGVVFSPDSKYALFTMATFPPGFGAMNGRAWQPCGNETVLVEVATGKRLWSLRSEKHRSAMYAVHRGFAAVAADGAVAAFADFNGRVYLVEKSGKIIGQAETLEPASARGRQGPTDGVGVWLADNGALAAFGFKNLLVLAKAGKFTKVKVSEMISGCATADGALAVIGCDDGKVQAFDADGALRWTFDTQAVGPLVANAGSDRTLVATSQGQLIMLDGAGKEIWRAAAAESADRQKHPLAFSAAGAQTEMPLHYRDPYTLALAQKLLQAKRLWAWQPQGQGREAYGRVFHTIAAPLQIASEGQEVFLHLVYRRPPENKSLSVSAEGKDGKETFFLDLETPEYRVVDIPARGPQVKFAVMPEGAVEISECSVWEYRWPGANLAYVKQEGGGEASAASLLEDDATADEHAAAAAAQELEGSATTGAMKDCAIWWPNTDVDLVAGPWLKPKVSGLAMVDGKRFGNGKIPPWVDNVPRSPPLRGGWFTIDFGKPVSLSLVATYDRANKQSEVSQSLAVLRNGLADAEETEIAAG